MAEIASEEFLVMIHLLGGRQLSCNVEPSQRVSVLHARASDVLHADEFHEIQLFQGTRPLDNHATISEAEILPGCIVQAVLVATVDKAVECVRAIGRHAFPNKAPPLPKMAPAPPFKAVPPGMPPKAVAVKIKAPPPVLETHAQEDSSRLFPFQSNPCQSTISDQHWNGKYIEVRLPSDPWFPDLESENEAGEFVKFLKTCWHALGVLADMQYDDEGMPEVIERFLCWLRSLETYAQSKFIREREAMDDFVAWCAQLKFHLAARCIPLCCTDDLKVSLGVLFVTILWRMDLVIRVDRSRISNSNVIEAIDFLHGVESSLPGQIMKKDNSFETMLCKFASTYPSAGVRTSAVKAIVVLTGCKYHQALKDISKLDPDEDVREACVELLDVLEAKMPSGMLINPPLVGPPAAPAAVGKLPIAPTPVAIASTSAIPNPLKEAIPETSEHDALLLEQAELQEALLKSKADARNADGVVIVRLTAHSPQIKHHLLNDMEIETCFDRVKCAQCDVCPGWANGAIMLVPLTQEQLIEAGIQLQAHNIVCLAGDVALVEQALKKLPKRKSAQLKPEHHVDKEVPDKKCRTFSEPRTDRGNQLDSNCQLSPITTMSSRPHDIIDRSSDDWNDVSIEVQNTFLKVHLPHFELSESSTVVQSAPAASELNSSPHPNPRRWKKE